MKDSRIQAQKLDSFLDLMEDYFEKRAKQFDKGEVIDVFPEHEYEVGLTLPYSVKIRDNQELR